MKPVKIFLLVGVFLACCTQSLLSAQRVQYGINTLWEFSKCSEFTDSEAVNFPHTWNAEDAVDEIDGYYRGEGWYRRTLNVKVNPEEIIYVHFEGANQVTELFVNGKSAGVHKGGYTAFNFDVTELVVDGANDFVIKVDNSHDPDIFPLSADFTFFGGIYRDVYLVHLPKVTIFDEEYASSGVLINTEISDASQMKVKIRTKVVNREAKKQSIFVENVIVDPMGAEVARVTSKFKAEVGESTHTEEITLKNPVLWSIDNPNLYQVFTRVLDSSKQEIDGVANTMGARWYSFDVNNGFYLNGEYVKLVGTCRHQFFEGKGSALEDAMHVKDINLLKDMGGNFLRISHYPQDPTILEMCDRLGIITSVEIPMVNAITISEEHLNRGVEMATEMVYQSYNSPSVLIWAYMNEIMLRPPYATDTTIDKDEYGAFLYKITKSINDRIKEIDPCRKTMFVCHGNSQVYSQFNLTSVADILGWNLYHGWYSNSFEGFEQAIDQYRSEFPDKIHMLTEYGADVDPRLHCFVDAERFDFTSEYGVLYHKHYLKAILERDYIAGCNIWNLNDFYSEYRRDAVPYVNNKGITGLDRERKDTYYLYKAYISNEPVVHIVNKAWKVRSDVASGDNTFNHFVEVYTNQASVELFVNGKSYGSKSPVDHSIIFDDVEFVNGDNTILAISNKDGVKSSDHVVVNYMLVPSNFTDDKTTFREMNVMLGSRRYFEDRDNDVCWIPEQEYSEGSWGYIGGEPFRGKTRYGTLLGSMNDIMGSGNDPIYQTQRIDIEGFRADVPDGRYTVELLLSELLSNEPAAALAYNLGNDVINEAYTPRIFDISINDILQRENLEIVKEYGGSSAVTLRFMVVVRDGEGLNIQFTPKEGIPVLNAIRIFKNL
ncbi:MAG: glycoside hydrolase family 2 TIM barrel-domain containing protein [Rikenellaceae bacterium]